MVGYRATSTSAPARSNSSRDAKVRKSSARPRVRSPGSRHGVTPSCGSVRAGPCRPRAEASQERMRKGRRLSVADLRQSKVAPPACTDHAWAALRDDERAGVRNYFRPVSLAPGSPPSRLSSQDVILGVQDSGSARKGVIPGLNPSFETPQDSRCYGLTVFERGSSSSTILRSTSARGRRARGCISWLCAQVPTNCSTGAFGFARLIAR